MTLGVSDVARARAFYEALGWTSESEGDDVVFFQAGGMVVALWNRARSRELGVADDGTRAASRRSRIRKSSRLAHDVSSPRCRRPRDDERRARVRQRS